MSRVSGALVITSISAPNTVLMQYSNACSEHRIYFVVVGDEKSPIDFQLSGCDFWSLERQRKMEFNLARVLPERHYARKNLGYLQAIRRDAKIIIETDDDNYPRATFWNQRQVQAKASLLENKGWVNVYEFFSECRIWPRGFPLEFTNCEVPSLDILPLREFYCPIQQGLADENPDVDAIYRLTMPLPISFASLPQIVVGKGTWCPFNSQNTTWFPDAYPLLYIPSYCSFRMCDIWRSFIALRICWANDWGVLFHGPTVWQERNEHSLLKDFEDEIPGYLNNARICQELGSLDIQAGRDHIASNLIKCYQALIKLGVIHESEIALLTAWLEDLETLAVENSKAEK